MKRTELAHFESAGYKFTQCRSVLGGPLPAGMPVSIVPEPENPYDPFAMRLDVAAGATMLKIGYIPKGLNQVLLSIPKHFNSHLEDEASMANEIAEEGGLGQKGYKPNKLGFSAYIAQHDDTVTAPIIALILDETEVGQSPEDDHK